MIVILYNDVIVQFLNSECPSDFFQLDLPNNSYLIVFTDSEFVLNTMKLYNCKILSKSEISTVHFSMYNIWNLPDYKDTDLIERFIATDAYSSFMYSATVIKSVFELGEPIMRTNDNIWEAYSFFKKKGKIDISPYSAKYIYEFGLIKNDVIYRNSIGSTK